MKFCVNSWIGAVHVNKRRRSKDEASLNSCDSGSGLKPTKDGDVIYPKFLKVRLVVKI